MIRMIRRTMHPERYHGHKAAQPFFEGWYFKLVSKDESRKLAIIPGIYKGHDESHAFIQILNGATGESEYHTFPSDNFFSPTDAFDIRIGDNRFTARSISLWLDNGSCLRGRLDFTGLKGWPVRLWSPGIMGWYAWIPFMECFHGILSLDHMITGTLESVNQHWDFSGGRGYTEKDWGKRFPEAYIWFQSNHFDRPGICLTASVAIIPWIRRPFPGFIVGFLLDGRLYRFATYTGAGIRMLRVSDREVHWVIEGKGYVLKMTAMKEAGGILHAPGLGGMDRRISESMTSTVRVTLYRSGNGKRDTIYEGIGRNTGVEAAGDTSRIIEMWGG